MKTEILTHTIAALIAAVPFAQADDKQPDPPKDAGKPSSASASTSVVTSSDGTATVTIDINGKKETRTFKLGDGTNTFSSNSDADRRKDPGFRVERLFEPVGKREKGPWVGIAMEPVQDVVRAQLQLAPGEGVVINHVMSGSPAEKAGLEANDILLRFDDQIIVEPSQLRKLIAMKKPGDSVKLVYLRKGERHDTKVTLIEHEFEPNSADSNMPWMQPFQRVQGLDAASRVMEDLLRHWKHKHPGIVAEKWSWPGAPAGKSPWDAERIKPMIDQVRKDLENSGIAKEEQQRILKNVEERMEQIRKGNEEMTSRLKRWLEDKERKRNEKKQDEAPKKPGEPL